MLMVDMLTREVDYILEQKDMIQNLICHMRQFNSNVPWTGEMFVFFITLSRLNIKRSCFNNVCCTCTCTVRTSLMFSENGQTWLFLITWRLVKTTRARR